jgi:type IV pilus assembly protein PilE
LGGHDERTSPTDEWRTGVWDRRQAGDNMPTFAHASKQPMKRTRGFTLIELLITVAIAAILASIAYPSFMEAIRKGRRAEAVEWMTRIQQAEEQWRARTSSYTDNLGATGLNVPETTPNGYYKVVVVVPADEKSASEYTITATASGSQAADTKCATLSMAMSGGYLKYDSTNGQACWSK